MALRYHRNVTTPSGWGLSNHTRESHLLAIKASSQDINRFVTSCRVAQRNVNKYFLGALQHENKVTKEKQFGSKYLSAFCFINLLINHLLHIAPCVTYQ